MKLKPISNFKFLISALLLVLAMATAWIWFTRKTPEVIAGWWNDSWSYRKAIVINHDYVQVI